MKTSMKDRESTDRELQLSKERHYKAKNIPSGDGTHHFHFLEGGHNDPK